MKINWKRVVIAGIWSEFLLFAIYIPARMYAGWAGILAMLGSMFLGGLWVARKVEARFLLHGVLVGIFAGVVFYVLLFAVILFWPKTDIGALSDDIFATVTKILGAAIGGYVGGKLRKKALA